MGYASLTHPTLSLTRGLLLCREIRGAISSAVILDSHDVRRMALLAATLILQRWVRPRIARMSQIAQKKMTERMCGWGRHWDANLNEV